MRSASASSPEVSRRIPERFLPASSAATMRPSEVVSGLGNASLGNFSTWRGRPTQPDRRRTRTAIAGSALRMHPAGMPHFGLRIEPSYQAHFGPMQQTPRHIRSFVLRAGRMTPAQERALADGWPAYGLEL